MLVKQTMTFVRAVSITALVALGSLAQVALADDATATKTIAGVLAGLNHFPSAEDKAALAAIASDEANGMAVRALAGAVAEIQHAATAEGKAAMQQIVASDMANAQAKTLAEIVLNINHVPSAEAKATLQEMM